MRPYEILEHTTDLKIRAFGRTKEELFSNMLGGMFEGARVKVKDKRSSVAKDMTGKGRSKISRLVKIKSADEQSLLVDFLSEALYLSDVNNEAYLEVKFKKLIETELTAEIFGQPIEKLGLEIKAVTYHGLEIKKIRDYWQATVLFDI